MSAINPYIETRQFGSQNVLTELCFRPENSDKLKSLAKCIPTLFFADHKAVKNILNSVIGVVGEKIFRTVEFTEIVRNNVKKELKDRCNITNEFHISSQFAHFLLDAWAPDALPPSREVELQAVYPT